MTNHATFFSELFSFPLERVCLLDVNPQLKVGSFTTAPGKTRVVMIGTILKRGSRVSRFSTPADTNPF